MKIGENKLFSILTHIILTVASVSCVVPFLLLFISSFTDEKYLLKYGYTFFPSELSLSAYEYLLKRVAVIANAYGITVLVTVVGTVASMVITSLLAYALSRREIPGHKLLSFLVVFSILFNGGLVPTYIMYTQYFGIKNTIYSLIVPRLLLTGFNVLITRTFFMTNIPPALMESAQIDGAGEFRVFFKIVLPLSLPIMATIGLMSGIAYWNDWFNGLIYLTDNKLFSLQVMLNQILLNIQFLANSEAGARAIGTEMIPGTSVRMAIAVIGIIPIITLYPFFQKYFVKGITLGAVKG